MREPDAIKFNWIPISLGAQTHVEVAMTGYMPAEAR